MKKIIASILMGVACLMPTDFGEEYKDLVVAMQDCYKIEITIDNEVKSFEKGSDEFIDFVNTAVEMLEDSHEMPAFGVSLDNETREAKKTGTWVELIFRTTNTHNEMPFDKLLVEVQSDWTGFNIIRYYNGKYDGRCFYVDLVDNNMSKLYNFIHSL